MRLKVPPFSMSESVRQRNITHRAIPEMVPVGFPLICDRCVLGAINGTLSLNACRQMMFSPTHDTLGIITISLVHLFTARVTMFVSEKDRDHIQCAFFPYILGKRRFSPLQDQFLTMELFMCPAGNLSISLFKCGSEGSHECLHFVPLHDCLRHTLHELKQC